MTVPLDRGGNKQRVASVNTVDATVPTHIQESVASIAELHAKYLRSAPRPQRLIEWLISRLGRPWFVFGIIVFVALWIAVNVGLVASGHAAFDPPQFSWLQGLVSLTALLITSLVLAAEKRMDRLAERRAQLTLEMALLTEQKIAKVIQLLEQLRREHPDLPDRLDPEAVAMGLPADPTAVIEIIEEAHRDALGGSAECP